MPGAVDKGLRLRDGIPMTRCLMGALAVAFAVAAVTGRAVTLSPDGIADRLPHLPTIFAPGIISGPAHDSAPAFAPDGKTVYFTRSNAAQSTIFVSHCDAGNWQDPTIAPFSGEWNDMEPAFAPDGSYLVFVSNRPTTAGGGPIQGRFNGTVQKGGNLWRVDRSATAGMFRSACRTPSIRTRARSHRAWLPMAACGS